MFQEFTGLQYVKIAIANAYGLDKENWESRIDWADDFLGKSKADQEALIQDADEPLLMRKAINAYHDAINGTPTGYIMSLDATSSCFQIYAVLTGCEETARNCNVIDTGNRVDAYTIVQKEMNALGTSVTRDGIKKPVMTTTYGSTAEPKNIFGKGTPELKAFYLTLNKKFKGAVEGMDDISSCWNNDALYHSWTLPDGHVAKVPVTEMVQKKIEVQEIKNSNGNNATFTHQAEVNKPSDYGVSIMANVIQSVDAYIVREMIRRAHMQGFQLLTIHDSFWASPNHINKVRRNYNEILSEIAESNLMETMLNEVSGYDAPYDKEDNDIANLVLEANYSLS